MCQVYTSHMQLGGPKVMGLNGVSHHLVSDDLEGARTILQLLSFVPPEVGGDAVPLVLPSSDPVDRLVGYAPGPAEKLDPRAAISGTCGTHTGLPRGCAAISGACRLRGHLGGDKGGRTRVARTDMGTNETKTQERDS